jgi:hypothetical protein
VMIRFMSPLWCQRRAEALLKRASAPAQRPEAEVKEEPWWVREPWLVKYPCVKCGAPSEVRGGRLVCVSCGHSREIL